ncbi:MAG: SAM-dependent chlorinase/fluorinase [Chloroflexota bacterium]
MNRLIALLTDFGTTDTYVGVMKGVMLDINPALHLVDLTHAIQPQNIKQAAFALLNSYSFFPPQTVFLVVVDPGVGSARKPIAVRAGHWLFVAPDNGVLSYALRDIGHPEAAELENQLHRLKAVSNTFHGRDIFAPAAAHLTLDVSFDHLGTRVEPVMLPEPQLVIEGNFVRGEVLHIDHFGNVITSIGLLNWDSPEQLTLNPRFGTGSPFKCVPASVEVSVPVTNATVPPLAIRHTYAEVEKGEPLALVGSSGYLELSLNQGNFAEKYAVHIGDPVELRFADRIE